MTIKNKLNQIWKDPVWSKVIATGLIFLFSQLLIWVWSLIEQISFIAVYKKLIIIVTLSLRIELWMIVAIFVVIYVLFNLYKGSKVNRLINGIRNYKLKIKSETPPISEVPVKTPIAIHTAPTVFFHGRICDAFPGVDNIVWFNSPKEAIKRLEILLRPPTKFESASGYGITSDPIWWFRGGSALFIENFKILSKTKCLINVGEYLIDKIAVYRGASYFRDFVYVLCKPDKPIGIYKHDLSSIETYYEERGKYFEEYGLYKNRPITRQEYDDGAALIKGKVINVIGKTELRVRSLTKYNFIITSKFAPYNCNTFNAHSKEYFLKLLKNEIELEEFVEWTKEWPKNHNDE